MKKIELIRTVRAKTGLDTKTMIQVLGAISELVEERAKRGEPTFLPGIGMLEVHDRPARKVRNPKTGEMMMSSPKRLMKLKPLKRLRDAITHAASS